MNVHSQADSARKYYNRLSGSYEALSEGSERQPRLQGLRLLNPQKNEHFLEIGCGTGHAVIAMAHAVGPDGHVDGIDVSEAMLALAETRAIEEGVEEWTHLQVADAQKLPFEVASFDGVFVSFTLELFSDTEIPLVLAEIRRVLKPGGRLAVVALSKESHDTIATRVYETLHRLFPTMIDCHPIHAPELLEAAGFNVESNEPFSMWGITGRALLARPAL